MPLTRNSSCTRISTSPREGRGEVKKMRLYPERSYSKARRQRSLAPLFAGRGLEGCLRKFGGCDRRKVRKGYCSSEQSAPPPELSLISAGSSVQLNFVTFSIIEPAAPSAVIPAEASVA